MVEPQDIGSATERELLERVYTGRKAEELLAEPLMIRWLKDVDTTIVACMRTAGERNDDMEMIHFARLLEAARIYREAFTRYMQAGHIAEEQLRRPGLIKRQVSRFKWKTAN